MKRMNSRLDKLEKVNKQVQCVSLLNNFSPRPDQPELLDQQQSFYDSDFTGINCAISGNGAGKTFCASAKAARFLLTTPPPEVNTPFWVVSTKMDDATKNCWGQNLSKFIPQNYINAIRWYSEKEGLPRSVILKQHENGNNFVIEFRSYDQGRSKFQGASIAGCLLDEQCPQDVLNEIIARTRKWNYPGSKIYVLTPIDPDPHLEGLFNEPPSSWRFFRMNTRVARDKGHVTQDFVQHIQENTLDALVETRLTGVFATYEGAIYKEFNPKIHVVNPFEIPKSWIISRGIDIGWSHDTACVWVAKDNNTNTHYVFKEYLKSQTYIDAHVKSINEGWDDYPNRAGTYIDAANAQVVAEMELKGLRCQPAVKDVKAGIGTIQSLLRPDGNGRPKLFIFNNCENLIRQIRIYIWDKDKLDMPKKETASSLNDLNDALRYALHSPSKGLIKYEPVKVPDKAVRPLQAVPGPVARFNQMEAIQWQRR